jgi:light-regulated signal transduction histidine kinase (bacteriophytochrome)
MADEKRLERIENKLDEMSEAIVSLARMEERMVTLFKRMDSYDDAQDKLADRVSKIEKVSGADGVTLRFLERIFWIVATAGITAYVVTHMS